MADNRSNEYRKAQLQYLKDQAKLNPDTTTIINGAEIPILYAVQQCEREDYLLTEIELLTRYGDACTEVIKSFDEVNATRKHIKTLREFRKMVEPD